MIDLIRTKVPLMVLSIILFLSACTSEREFIISSDYSYDGNFRKYKTFDFMNNTSVDSLFNEELVERTIIRRLNAQGYDQQSRKPDLVITYSIFRDDFYFSGFDQPNFNTWVGGKILQELSLIHISEPTRPY